MQNKRTTAQAAELLGYHRATIANLIKRGELHANRISPRLLLLDRAEVEAFATRKRTRGRPKGWRARIAYADRWPDTAQPSALLPATRLHSDEAPSPDHKAPAPLCPRR